MGTISAFDSNTADGPAAADGPWRQSHGGDIAGKVARIVMAKTSMRGVMYPPDLSADTARGFSSGGWKIAFHRPHPRPTPAGLSPLCSP